MSSDCGSCIAKYLLCIFNFIFFVSIYAFIYLLIFMYILLIIFYKFISYLKKKMFYIQMCKIKDHAVNSVLMLFI